MSENNETDDIRKDLDALRKDLRELADSVRASGEKQAKEYLDQARERGKAVGAEIEARPFTSVLAAFGVGLVLGRLFGR